MHATDAEIAEVTAAVRSLGAVIHEAREVAGKLDRARLVNFGRRTRNLAERLEHVEERLAKIIEGEVEQ